MAERVDTMDEDWNGTSNKTVEIETERTIYEYLGFGCSLVMIVISFVGVIGNGYAVWHFGRPSSRSSVNVLLTALSAFDLILLCAGAPMYSLLGIYSFDRRPDTLLSLAYCMTCLYGFSHMAQFGSIYTMCLISFERYLGVCHPFVARLELTARRARIAVVIVTLIAILYNLCRFWEYEVDGQGFPSAMLRSDPLYMHVYVHWMYFVFLFSIPFLAIFIFNILVMVGVRKASVNRPRCQMNAQQRGEAKTTLMLLVVVAVFFACNSLAWLLNGYEVLGYQPTDPAFEFVSDLNNLLVLAHPAFNIFVYARFSAKFRRDFMSCFCRRLHPSLVPNSSHGASCNGHSSYTRVAKNYAVLSAMVVRPGVNRVTQPEETARQQETCMSGSTTATTVIVTPPGTTTETLELVPRRSVTRDLLEDNKKELLKTLGFQEADPGPEERSDLISGSDMIGTICTNGDDEPLVIV